MKRIGLIGAACLGVLAGTAQAQDWPKRAPAAAPAEPGALPLYGPGADGNAASENWQKYGGNDYVVRNVTRATLTPFLPDPAKATGAAVIVAPGGAFMQLSMSREGWDVARWLAARGIAAFVLKYRLVPSPADDGEYAKFQREQMAQEIGSPMEGPLLKRSPAPADARAALAMIRANSAQWRIDPARVGMIGFSAGAMTARRAGLDLPPAERPAFIGYIYGPQDAEAVPADAPALFNAIALDDALFPSKGFPIAAAWLAAKRPVEIHGYQKGNHGFGMGAPGTTTTLVMDEFATWLDANGFLGAKSPARKDSK